MDGFAGAAGPGGEPYYAGGGVLFFRFLFGPRRADIKNSFNRRRWLWFPPRSHYPRAVEHFADSAWAADTADFQKKGLVWNSGEINR